jgi:hypothetical protein
LIGSLSFKLRGLKGINKAKSNASSSVRNP